MNASVRRLSLCVAVCFSIALPASAYKLATKATAEERQLAGITDSSWTATLSYVAWKGVPLFTQPVHEEITNRIFGCNGDVCSGSNATQAPPAVLAGVRWNDDPPFRTSAKDASKLGCKIASTIRFETQPNCWYALFHAAEKGAAAGEAYGPGDAMLYRTHFGDLQFLHAMATKDGELARETKDRLMDWFEFAWRTSAGEYTLDTRLRDIQGNPTIAQAFGKTDWRVMDLFTQGASGGLRGRLKEVAFGSLLHTLEDSYAAGHADREESSGTASCSAGAFSARAPGAIKEFHAYNKQNHSAHAKADGRDQFMATFQQPGNVVDVGRALKDARDAQMQWEAVEPFLDCVFSLANPDAKAGPGEAFE